MRIKVWKILALLSVMIFVVSCASMVHAVTQLSVPPTITVGSSPEYAAYDSAKGEIFVTNQGDGSVSVISDSSNSVIQTIAGVGQYPTGIACDSSLGEMFVTCEGDGSNSGSVAVISDSSNSVVQTITVGIGPEGIAYDSGKGEMFVTNSNYANSVSTSIDTVSVISDSTNTVVATVNVGAGPIGVAYDSAKGEIFVANELSTGNTISVISDSTNKVVATVNGGNGAEGLAYDSAKGEIFVADNVDGGFTVISDSNNAVVSTNTLASAAYSGNPHDLAYDSSKAEVFEETGTYIVAISDKSNDVTAYAPLVQLPISGDSYGPLAQGVAYDSAKGEIFVVNGGNNDVSVLSDSGTAASTSPSSSASASSTPTTTPASSSAPSSGYGNLLFIIVGVIAVVVVVGLVGFKFTRGKAGSKGPVTIPAASGSVGSTVSPKTDDDRSGSVDESKASASVPSVTAQESNNPTDAPQSTQQTQHRPLSQKERAERFRRLVNTFQQKGATSPEKALTAEQPDLSPQFEQYMETRQVKTKIFVEVNGKYYLDQKALQEMRKQMANRTLR
jgi:YVTN family beta-propeller protein